MVTCAALLPIKQVLRLPTDVTALAALLASRLSTAEKCQVGKLDAMYSAAATAVQCPLLADQEAALRRCIDAYFAADVDHDSITVPQLVRANASTTRRRRALISCFAFAG